MSIPQLPFHWEEWWIQTLDVEVIYFWGKCMLPSQDPVVLHPVVVCIESRQSGKLRFGHTLFRVTPPPCLVRSHGPLQKSTQLNDQMSGYWSEVNDGTSECISFADFVRHLDCI